MSDRRAGLDLAHVADAIGDPSRAAMLIALMGGVALPASELARRAGVGAPTASSHLGKLAAAGLVDVRSHGRHRYFALAGVEVADAVERLAALAPRGATAASAAPDRERRAEPLAIARTCYRHLAGKIAVAWWARAGEAGWVEWEGERVVLQPAGRTAWARRGLALDDAGGAALSGRACLDWTERVPHVSGTLGTALCRALLEGAWVKRTPGGRALRVTATGEEGLSALGVRWRG